MPNDKKQADKTKILYLITQSELGGAQRYVFDLAANLRNEFNVAVAFGEQSEKGKLAEQLKQAGITYYTIPRLKRAISPINDLIALFEIIKLIKKIKPDIIHLNSSKISILGSLASLCVMRYALCVYTVHGWVFNEPLPKWQKLFYKYAEKFTAPLKDKIICVSEFDRQAAIKLKIAPEKKLIAIHNGITPINFLSKEEISKKLFSQINNSKFKIQNSKFLIGSIANLYKTKGLEHLIQAVYILITNYKLQITAIIIGEGEERKYLENLISQLNLQNNIILAGRIDNAAELLPAFDIYACPSVKEGLSYTIMEAMQIGLPIAATNAGGNSELIEDGKTGLLTEIKNPQMLAEKIAYLINNPGARQALGANAKEKAMDKFGLERMIERTREVYLE